MASRTRIGLAVTALSASFLAGVAVTGGLTGGPPVGEDPLRLTNAALRPATSCEQLRQWYVDRALDQVTAWGWGNPYPVYWMDDIGGGVADTAASGPATPTARAEDAVGSSETGTNVQESGVDEPDSVKTDGSLLVTVDGARLTTYDVSGEQPELLASIVLPDLDTAEILLSGTTVVAVGRDSSVPQRRAVPGTVFPGIVTDTRVVTVDVGEPASPAILDSRVFDADVVAVRQHADVVRLVLSSGLPDLPFTIARGGRRTEQAALEHNRQVVRESTVDDWLPSVTNDTGSAPAVDCADVALPRDDAGLGTMTVVAFRAGETGSADTTAVATSSQTAYLSQDSLYLASSPWSGWWGPAPMPLADDRLGGGREEDGVTRLYAFGLDGTTTTYRASGEVEGLVASRWAMDAVDGSLRLAVGPTVETGNYNSIVTMGERDGSLVETGRVDALGVGEQIKSVRWFDDLAVLVTFRQTDPLYAVDLSVPGAPRLLGELKIPGFSEYLHPIGDDRLLGVGQDATLDGSVRGAQIALFDIADVGSPQRLDVAGFRRTTGALAGQDPRQFTWLADRQTALTVLADWRTGTGSIAVVRVVGGSLETRTQQVEAGRDVARLRLVPLADGRVVLWTGSEVSFFPVG